MKFEYPEDKEYFNTLLDKLGGVEENMDLFDFRDPTTKRSEFSLIRNKVMSHLIELYGNICQLNYCPECTNNAEQVDHLIPLSTNKLNKELRKLKGELGKEVIAQSFGSNNENNFVLACTKCNGKKKHRLLTKEELVAVCQRQQK